ncbi:exopolygalacturonase-like [Nymphaea colorata]|nr:exopolygalacturonase-like [Nymphaea colorata]
MTPRAISCLWVVLPICIHGILLADAGNQIFNVKKFGAKADGETDDRKAVLDAWNAACASNGRPRVVIPPGTFLIGQTKFEGPCPGAYPIVVEVKGKVIAPTDLSQFSSDDWISFSKVHGLVLTGGGVFDGRGSSAWPSNDCLTSANCKLLPTSLKFNFLTNSTIRRISSVDSKFFHMIIFGSENVKAHDLRISAPSDSPNTDGIHIGDSTGIAVSRSVIGTGDDCISIGPGSNLITISNIICGPGHGISVGSLGKYRDEKDVTDLRVRNCTFRNTTNGLRIKTWPASGVLHAKNFTFEDIIMKNVHNPIIIDQKYCPYDSCPTEEAPSKVKISNVNFRNVKGTSTSQVAVNLICSKAFPCEGVTLSDIDLKYNGEEGKATSSCFNVNGFSSGTQVPPPCV